MRDFVFLCLVLVVATTSCAAESAGLTRFTLFENGETAMKIVLPVVATDAERDAAAELKHFLDRSSGTSFEIMTENKAKQGLFIGRTKLAKEWQLPPAPPMPEQDEGFVIEVRSDQQRAVIVGTIDMATKFAVYNFLDRFVGVRWFLPGKLFEVIPTHDKLVIPDGKINELPALSGRVFGYAMEGAMYADNPDPQLGTPFVDFHSDPKAVRGRHVTTWWGCHPLGCSQSVVHGRASQRSFPRAQLRPDLQLRVILQRTPRVLPQALQRQRSRPTRRLWLATLHFGAWCAAGDTRLGP